MKRLLLTLFFVTINAQITYSEIKQKAEKTLDEAKSQQDFKLSLSQYEDAFVKFPDSLRVFELYDAAIAASKSTEYNKAFNFLNQLLKTDIDARDNIPGWDLILDQDADNDFEDLIDDKRWGKIKQNAISKKNIFYHQLKENETEFFSTKENTLLEISKAEKLYQQIRNYNPYLPKKNQNYSITFPINDSIKTAFLIHLPKNYNPENKYPILFFLHGAVRHNDLSLYQPIQSNLENWNRYYTKYGDQNDVVLVFPRASKRYNWMSPDEGFFMIPSILKLLKKGININDNKVFVSGHSNGATGSFSYLMKQPTPFAGFYGFNTYPKVFTGGTFIENIKNRSFINFSTDEDYYYPPNANNSFSEIMKTINADYKDYRYKGFPHWFPQFNESEPAYKILFEDLNKRNRNPFPKEISWELDDEKNGNIDWISNIKLDTLSSKTYWQKELNFNINQWLEYDNQDRLITKEVKEKAFDFPRKSGKIIAKYNQNIFDIETSRIKSFSILISPEMVDLKKKIRVYINGKLRFIGKVNYQIPFMSGNFEQSKDREQVWINKINLDLK